MDCTRTEVVQLIQLKLASADSLFMRAVVASTMFPASFSVEGWYNTSTGGNPPTAPSMGIAGTLSILTVQFSPRPCSFNSRRELYNFRLKSPALICTHAYIHVLRKMLSGNVLL